MLEMIALILQRIEGLILDLPAPTSGAHHPLDRLGAQRQVGDPGPALDLPLPVGLVVEPIVDKDIHGAVAEAEIGAPGKVRLDALGVSKPEFFDLSARPPSSQLFLQAGV